MPAKKSPVRSFKKSKPALKKPLAKKKNLPKKPNEISIDAELAKLEREHEKAVQESLEGLEDLKYSILEYEEEESLRILREKYDKEKEYLQSTIIMMELKQLAESIQIITHRQKIS